MLVRDSHTRVHSANAFPCTNFRRFNCVLGVGIATVFIGCDGAFLTIARDSVKVAAKRFGIQFVALIAYLAVSIDLETIQASDDVGVTLECSQCF